MMNLDANKLAQGSRRWERAITFKANWKLLTTLSATPAKSPASYKEDLKTRTRFLQAPVHTNFRQRFKKLAVHITH